MRAPAGKGVASPLGVEPRFRRAAIGALPSRLVPGTLPLLPGRHLAAQGARPAPPRLRGAPARGRDRGAARPHRASGPRSGSGSSCPLVRQLGIEQDVLHLGLRPASTRCAASTPAPRRWSSRPRFEGFGLPVLEAVAGRAEGRHLAPRRLRRDRGAARDPGRLRPAGGGAGGARASRADAAAPRAGDLASRWPGGRWRCCARPGVRAQELTGRDPEREPGSAIRCAWHGRPPTLIRSDGHPNDGAGDRASLHDRRDREVREREHPEAARPEQLKDLPWLEVPPARSSAEAPATRSDLPSGNVRRVARRRPRPQGGARRPRGIRARTGESGAVTHQNPQDSALRASGHRMVEARPLANHRQSAVPSANETTRKRTPGSRSRSWIQGTSQL